MKISFNKKGKVTFAKVIGELNFDTSEEFKRAFQDEIDKDARNFVLDFSGVLSINSTGLGMILLFYKELKKLDGNLRIVGLNDNIYEMMNLMRLDKLISMEKIQETKGK